MNAKTLGALPKAAIHFIEPMYARLVNELPEGNQWLYEVKFDGYRCLAGRHSSAVALWSRQESSFTKQFPQIAKACERLPANTLIDGEIVALDESGRVSFNLLQHHRSKARALVLYAFDVLIYRGRSFVPRVRHEVASKLKEPETNTCPFTNLPERKRTQWALTKEEMKNFIWLKPELVAQVEFTEWTPDGHLRHSKFVGLRDDKAAREVVREIGG